MDIKTFNKIVKDEKIKTADEILIKVDVQDEDGSWRKVVVPVETYNITRNGEFQLSCCVWNPKAEN